MDTSKLDQICMGCFAERPPGATVCPACGYSEASREDSPYQLQPRTVLAGKYLIGRILGEGGFGITYMGLDTNLDMKVAVKEYYPAGFVSRTSTASCTVTTFGGEKGEMFAKGRDRFVDEAKRLAKFRTLPGIVMVYDFFPANGTAYIVMEYVEGMTLKAYLAQLGGRMPADMVFNLMTPVFTSLAEVHKTGLIHRDISPDNIMLTHEGTLKLLDFGAAREFDDANRSLSVMLKPGYAPSEQYSTRGVQGPWTDVYALSATIYKMLTGATPDESMERIIQDRLAPPSAYGVMLPPHQEAALMRGLAVSVHNRFQTVGELYAALVQGAGFSGSGSAVGYTGSIDGVLRSGDTQMPVVAAIPSYAPSVVQPQPVAAPQYGAPQHGNTASPMHAVSAPQPQQYGYPPPVAAQPYGVAPTPANAPAKKSNKTPAIVAACIAAVFVIVAMILLSLPDGDAPDGPSAAQTGTGNPTTPPSGTGSGNGDTAPPTPPTGVNTDGSIDARDLLAAIIQGGGTYYIDFTIRIQSTMTDDDWFETTDGSWALSYSGNGSIASDGDKYATRLAISIEGYTQTFRTVRKDGRQYNIDDASRTIEETRVYEEDLFEFQNYTKTGEGRGEIDGRTLPYEEYDMDGATTARFYIDGGRLYGYVLEEEGVRMTMVFTNQSDTVPAGAFDLPSDYTLIPLDSSPEPPPPENTAPSSYIDAYMYRGMDGYEFTFLVTGTAYGSVWGSGIYTDDSNIPTAAIHAGLIRDGETAYVTIRIMPGQSSYESSTANGITTSSYGSWGGSYMFVP
uniref:Serine/threonine protein kinase n=1 Tax=uncultured bacterium contig00040 TaxID=1181528 RepID=A0A806KJJ9_9BACT|nr:serine/threonine protein kinase [uncultured bacterium contig00040]